jgi:hypothetical protein
LGHDRRRLDADEGLFDSDSEASDASEDISVDQLKLLLQDIDDDDVRTIKK